MSRVDARTDGSRDRSGSEPSNLDHVRAPPLTSHRSYHTLPDPHLRQESPKYVFQLYGYVQSQEGRDLLSGTAEGVLLYPVVGEHIDEFAVIGSHRYRFLTVDLSGGARSIREQILAVVN